MAEPHKLTPEGLRKALYMAGFADPENEKRLRGHIAALEAELTQLKNWRDHVKRAVDYPTHPAVEG